MFEVPEWLRDQERTMLGKNVVDEELKRGLGLSMREMEPFLRAGGDAAEGLCSALWLR
jgi:hypothetical protein